MVHRRLTPFAGPLIKVNRHVWAGSHKTANAEGPSPRRFGHFERRPSRFCTGRGAGAALSEELGDFLDTFPGHHDHLSPARGSFARIRGVHREAETHSEVL